MGFGTVSSTLGITGFLLLILLVAYLATRRFSTMPISEQYADARLVECPACGALPHHLCQDPDGETLVNDIHQVRWERVEDQLTYELIESPGSVGGWAIRCRKCGMTSHHPEDVKNRYCGNCHEFHNDLKVLG